MKKYNEEIQQKMQLYTWIYLYTYILESNHQLIVKS